MASNYTPDPNNIASAGNPVTPQSGPGSGSKVPYPSEAAQPASLQTPASGDKGGDLRRLPAGTLLSAGRYKIEKSIAAGGMGAVYRAIDVRFDDEPCAVKEMLDDFQKDVDRNQAVGAAVIIHAIVFGNFIIGGLFCLWRGGHTLGGLRAAHIDFKTARCSAVCSHLSTHN